MVGACTCTRRTDAAREPGLSRAESAECARAESGRGERLVSGLSRRAFWSHSQVRHAQRHCDTLKRPKQTYSTSSTYRHRTYSDHLIHPISVSSVATLRVYYRLYTQSHITHRRDEKYLTSHMQSEYRDRVTHVTRHRHTTPHRATARLYKQGRSRA